MNPHSVLVTRVRVLKEVTPWSRLLLEILTVAHLVMESEGPFLRSQYPAKSGTLCDIS
jgi:hypothetical protein